MKNLLTLLVAFVVLMPVKAFATADGPDYFAVTDVAANDTLNMRDDRHYKAKKVGEIPYNAVAIENLGCDSEAISLGEWARLSEQQKKDHQIKTWCRVRYNGTEGWVSGRYLREYEQEVGVESTAQVPVKEGLSPAEQEWMTNFRNDAAFAEDQLFTVYGVYATIKKLNSHSSKYFSDKEVSVIRRAIKAIDEGYKQYRPDMDRDRVWRDMESSMGGLIKMIETYSRKPSYSELQMIRGQYLEFASHLFAIAQMFSDENFIEDMPSPSGIEKDF